MNITRFTANSTEVGATPPSEFKIFTAGLVATSKGDFIFDQEAADSVMYEARTWGNDYPIDYEHASLAFISADPAEAGKAAGWFKPEIRAGALFATNVQWTPKATEKLKAREYRYFSPAADFEVTPDGRKRITRLINVALTNLPATRGLEPLAASQTHVSAVPVALTPEDLHVAQLLGIDLARISAAKGHRIEQLRTQAFELAEQISRRSTK